MKRIPPLFLLVSRLTSERSNDMIANSKTWLNCYFNLIQSHNWPIFFTPGDSGCGKSTLIQSFLKPTVSKVRSSVSSLSIRVIICAHWSLIFIYFKDCICTLVTGNSRNLSQHLLSTITLRVGRHLPLHRVQRALHIYGS